MQLVSLVCSKCGFPLVFDGRPIAKCGSCGVSFAIMDGNSGLKSVSYVPLQNTGRMTTPLKIALARKLREKTKFLVGDGVIFTGCVTEDKDGHFSYTEPISADSDSLKVGVAHKKQGRKNWLGKLLDQDIELVVMMEIQIVEVTATNDQIVGYAVEIEVRRGEFEQEANEICQIIISEFGVVPDCWLYMG